MSLKMAQSDLVAAQAALDSAEAERLAAEKTKDRKRIANADAAYDVACDRLREAREAFIRAGLS